jgi:hypothetical protein
VGYPQHVKRQGVKERVFGSYAKEARVSNARGKEVAWDIRAEGKNELFLQNFETG